MEWRDPLFFLIGYTVLFCGFGGVLLDFHVLLGWGEARKQPTEQ